MTRLFSKLRNWSKMKAVANNILNGTKSLKSVIERVENVVEKGENAGYKLFSSPEHKVLMVSYCDRAVSGAVVRRPSSTFYLVYALEATVLVGYS